MNRPVLNWYDAEELFFTSSPLFYNGNISVHVHHRMKGLTHCILRTTLKYFDKDSETIIVAYFEGDIPWQATTRERTFTRKGWIKSYFRRWRNYAKRKRAVRIIKKFYYDYVLPKIYCPHTRGSAFIKLLNKVEKL